ncbi:MAG: 4Fe-4S binding protein, partial [Acidaminococcaceae bacterium]|nr:4Fe-4S binding protein [Acidaminococcaceae bacterium]
DEAACVGCGICMRICPAHNIELQNGKACVGNHCACCMACVHNCPHGGMLVNGHTIKKKTSTGMLCNFHISIFLFVCFSFCKSYATI